MGNLNDFKNVNMRAKKYAEYFELSPEQIEKNGARFGFYLLALECVTNVKDNDELSNMIVDTSFRSIIYNEINSDLGVDVINIDKENQKIQLFNFKYREKFNQNKSQKLGDLIDMAKFLMCIMNENVEELESNLTKEKLKEIIGYLNSDEVWEIELYMISNDNNPLSIADPTISQFKEHFGMEVNTIVLDDIVAYISDFPDDLSAKFFVDNNSVMTYEEDELSTRKSYLIKICLAELIRITCSDEILRNSPTSDYSNLEDTQLDLSLLFDNVRGYLGQNKKYNSNIISTIKNSPSSFFMFNNGITITAKNINAGYKNGNKKFDCTINGFQIVNGGQTLRSIYAFKDDDFDEGALANAEVLVRIFQTESDSILTNNIAEYTNSQNAVSPVDLKSISNLQVQIGAYLESNNIFYVRKSGDIGDIKKNYEYRISMEKLAQILFSDLGNPDKSTNQKRSLFERNYDVIFNKGLDFENIILLINKYIEIEKIYKDSEYEESHQKYLYIIYLENKKPQNINSNIFFLENSIQEYKENESISPARKLIQKGFKTFIDERLNLYSLF